MRDIARLVFVQAIRKQQAFQTHPLEMNEVKRITEWLQKDLAKTG